MVNAQMNIATDLKEEKRKLKERNRRTLKRKLRKNKLIYVMLIPVIISLLVFSYYPMYGLVLALKDFSPRYGILGSKWIDPIFLHFEMVFATPYFWASIKNTLVISFLKIIFCFPAPIVLALLMNEVKQAKLKKSIQTIVYLPYFISWVIFGSIVYDIFGYEGVINNIASAMGFDRKAFMSDSSLYYPILLLFTIIKDSGWGSIIYMAAISNVSPSLYEAASIDGCGRFKSMWHITLPCISGIIVIQFLLAIGSIMNAGFDAIFNTYNKQIYNVADILDTYLYRIGFSDGNFEMATAIGFFKSVINFILLLTANFFVKKINGYGIYDLNN